MPRAMSGHASHASDLTKTLQEFPPFYRRKLRLGGFMIIFPSHSTGDGAGVSFFVLFANIYRSPMYWPGTPKRLMAECSWAQNDSHLLKIISV